LVAKAYNLTFDYVLNMSYANLIMYGAVIPSYNRNKDKPEEKGQKVIRADDPNSREEVRKFFETCD